MENNKRFYVILVIVLLFGNLFFGWSYFNTFKQLEAVKSSGGSAAVNEKVLNFAELFIKEVLQAEKEVDFETRLSLENAVRDLDDEEVMAEWQKFVGSKTEAEAQESVKRLLGILVSKIQK